MGCGGSKLEDVSEAVRLCRRRCNNLSEATRLRYALADAHHSYLSSLLSLSSSLHHFLLPTAAASPSPSPLLNLPPLRKGQPPPPPANLVSPPHSNSGHLEFNSSSDDDDGPLHSDHPSPMQYPSDHDRIATYTTTTTNFHYAKKGAPAAAVTYEQRPFGGDVGHVQFGGDPSSSVYPYYYPQNPDSFGGYPYTYPYGGAGAGHFGSMSQMPPVAAPAPPAMNSAPQPPPAPPSPPKTSTWDFLNPFESYESYFHNYTPSRSSRELREEEGIPDLEDEEMEVVKEAYMDEKLKAGPSSSGAGIDVAEEGSRGIDPEQHYKMRPSDAAESREVDVHVVSKNIIGEDGPKGKLQDSMQQRATPGSRYVPDVVQEIVLQFGRARNVGEEVSRMLEVGKIQYHQTKYQVVSSKMRYITPSLSTVSSSVLSTSKSSEFSDNASSAYYVENVEDKAMAAGNLSSTLQQLYIWEKKLLEEVKKEEDMRLRHERKSKRLKYLDERGAEPFKIDSTRHTVKKLATKIRIAIHFVHSISIRISKLRDGELWPQLRELIHGLVKMWQVLTECHRSQYQAMSEAKSLDAIANYAGKDATMDLIMELLKWNESFSSWVIIQKSFVKELNEWLKQYLLDEPEVTDDGVIPFSPGRLGAPPVFVICNYWSQAIAMISEAEVVEAMDAFTADILLIWRQRHENAIGRQSMASAGKQSVKDQDRDSQKIYRAVDAVNKKRTEVDTRSGYPHTRSVILLNHDAKSSSLHSSLQRCFEAMERFTESSLKVYEGLRARCEEEERDAMRSART